MQTVSISREALTANRLILVSSLNQPAESGHSNPARGETLSPKGLLPPIPILFRSDWRVLTILQPSCALVPRRSPCESSRSPSPHTALCSPFRPHSCKYMCHAWQRFCRSLVILSNNKRKGLHTGIQFEEDLLSICIRMRPCRSKGMTQDSWGSFMSRAEDKSMTSLSGEKTVGVWVIDRNSPRTTPSRVGLA